MWAKKIPLEVYAIFFSGFGSIRSIEKNIGILESL